MVYYTKVLQIMSNFEHYLQHSFVSSFGRMLLEPEVYLTLLALTILIDIICIRQKRYRFLWLSSSTFLFIFMPVIMVIAHEGFYQLGFSWSYYVSTWLSNIRWLSSYPVPFIMYGLWRFTSFLQNFKPEKD